MFKTVLAATDLSPASDRVIGCLHGLKPMGTERIILTHALGIRHLEELRYEFAPLVEPKLRQQKQVLESHGFAVDIVIASGIPSWEIQRVAKEKKASMMVIGSHGATLAREALIGGVATAVIHHAEAPVLVVRLRVADEVSHGCEMTGADFHAHVLYLTDFSDIAEHAFSYVEEIVRGGGRRVTLLHVQDKSRIDGHLADKLAEFNRIDRQRLERMESRLKTLGTARVDIELPYGLPKQEIVQRAEQNDYSLIVMGTQGRGFFGELFAGGVAHHVVRHTVVPTLLVPPVR
jgi:nucleotide-binding universal stress UspA family protein